LVPVSVRITAGDLVLRLAMARRIEALPVDAARELAIKYQLATVHTSLVVVAERSEAEKAAGIPVTVAVPHTLAAGWGGSAQVPMRAMMNRTPQALAEERMVSAYVSLPAFDDSGPLFDSSKSLAWNAALSDLERSELLRSLADTHAGGGPLPKTLADLAALHAMPQAVTTALAELIAGGQEEGEVVATFLALLSVHASSLQLGDAFRAALRGEALSCRRYRKLRWLVTTRVFA
jgi:hypothetical protein